MTVVALLAGSGFDVELDLHKSAQIPWPASDRLQETNTVRVEELYGNVEWLAVANGDRGTVQA